MEVLNTLVISRSSNRKLGPGVSTTYRQVGDSSKGEGTCPSKCPLLQSKVCYAMRHYVHMSAKRANGMISNLDDLTAKGDKLVRLHTSGDFFCSTGLDIPYINAVIEWCKKNPSVTVWTYTHGIGILIKHGYVNSALPKNLHIVASCDDDEEKELAKRFGFRTARVVNELSDKAEDETLCPYDAAPKLGKCNKKINCASCKLCFNPKHKKGIAFIKH